MLKITVEENAELVTLRLEGKIVGPWVAELGKTWRTLAPSLDSKKLLLDLRETTQMDAEGQHLLTEIYSQTGAEFQTNSLLIRFYSEKAMEESLKRAQKGA